MPKYICILGLNFFSGTLSEAITISKEGGLITFPSGPGLAELDIHTTYHKALQESDLIMVDSGLLALTWKMLTGISLSRISGYLFLKEFLKDTNIKSRTDIFWIMPNAYQMHKNIYWLKTEGFSIQPKNCYVAPLYNAGVISDSALLEQIKTQKPSIIILCLGGGIQEKLGLYLKENLDYTPTILCTGAAIAFLSGLQAYIPLWADRYFLGWLFRILQAPHIFLRRYWQARRLIPLLINNKEKTPIPRP